MIHFQFKYFTEKDNVYTRLEHAIMVAMLTVFQFQSKMGTKEQMYNHYYYMTKYVAEKHHLPADSLSSQKMIQER